MMPLSTCAHGRCYTVQQRGDAFVIVINAGDRVAQHTERFTAAAGGAARPTSDDTAGDDDAWQWMHASEAWHDSLGNASVRVDSARWEHGALHTQVVYASTGEAAYEAEWRREGQGLRYTLAREEASMWVLLK